MKIERKPHIAFLGIGLMGLPMARRLLDAGFSVSVWNRSLQKAEALQIRGAKVGETPSLTIRNADIVITMLADGAAVEAVVQQFLDALQPNQVLIDMSSTKQSEAIAMGKMIQRRGANFADAPVSGGVVGAENGTLAIMVGSTQETFDLISPLLEVLGRPTRVGDIGAGQLAKLCNQLIVGGTINIVAEALLLAQAGGADPAAVRNALRGGFAESKILELHGQRMLDRNFMPGGQVQSQAKDMRNILHAAQEANLTLPLTNLVAEIYSRLLKTYPHADHSAGLLDLENLNQAIRLGKTDSQLPN